MTPTILITGAAGGIGQALCKFFKDKEYFVIALDKVVCNEVACDNFIKADLEKFCQSTEYQDEIVETIYKSLEDKGLNGLINNAAVQIIKSTDNLTIDDWHKTLDINLIAPFLLTKLFLPQLESTFGSVVNIASIHSQLTKPQFVCYATSKSALVGLTKSMAVDLGSRIRVNAICPAAVETPMLISGFEGDEESLKELNSKHPLNRLAQPEEIAEAAFFLVSQTSSFITGTTLNVCGGISSRLHDPI